MAAKSPRSKKNSGSEQNAQEQKRNLIDSLELLRGGHDTPKHSAATLNDSDQATISKLGKEVERLQAELKATRSANAMLESDLRRIEQKALDTIAENGKLKRLLDQNGMSCCDEAIENSEKREDVLNELSQSRDDHFMLTQALIDSENEITRLTRTLEKLSRRLYAA